MKNICLSLFALLAFSISTLAQSDKSGYSVNDVATDFSLKNIDGKWVSLKDYKDAQGIILIFTCNHCPFSVAYEDRIIALHKAFAKKGFPVVAINSNDAIAYPSDSYEEMIVRAKEKKFPFAYLHDATQKYAHLYGAVKTPHVFVLRKLQDQFIVSYIGAIDDNSNEPELVKMKYVENAVESILAGKEVKPDFTKAVGCGIKWKQ
jgi:glutathione peroxidase-family protein